MNSPKPKGHYEKPNPTKPVYKPGHNKTETTKLYYLQWHYDRVEQEHGKRSLSIILEEKAHAAAIDALMYCQPHPYATIMVGTEAKCELHRSNTVTVHVALQCRLKWNADWADFR